MTNKTARRIPQDRIAELTRSNKSLEQCLGLENVQVCMKIVGNHISSVGIARRNTINQYLVDCLSAWDRYGMEFGLVGSRLALVSNYDYEL